MKNKQTPIEQLGLGVRVEKALRKLGVEDVKGLLAFDATKVLGVRGAGYGVYRRVLSIQEHLQAGRKKGPKARSSKLTFKILLSSLGSWPQRALNELGVNDLKDLAGTRYVDFLKLKGFGGTTWDEIASARREAIEVLGGITLWKKSNIIKEPRTLLESPPREETLLALPIFSDLDSELFSKPRFHPDWRSDWRIQDMALPVRARGLCRRLRAKEVRHLLLIPAREFLSARNSNLGTLRRVHETLQLVLLGGLERLQKEIDYRSPKLMINSWIKATLPRNLSRVASERFNIQKGRLSTYDRISKKLGVTRARVGQLWDNAKEELSRKQHLMVLDEFWNAVKEKVAEGYSGLEDLSEALSQEFGWNGTPPSAALIQLLELNPDFGLYHRGPRIRLKD